MDSTPYSTAFGYPVDPAALIALDIEEDAIFEDTIVGLASLLFLQKHRRELEASSEEDNDDDGEEEDDDEEDDEYDDEDEDEEDEEEDVLPIPPRIPESKPNILSRKRARSPLREPTPFLGQNRDVPAHARKRPRMEPPSSININMPKIQNQNPAELLAKLAETLREDATEDETQILRNFMDSFEQNMLRIGQQRHQQMYPGGLPFKYHEALEDAKEFMSGTLTPAEVERMSKQLQSDPRFPTAYLQATDSTKRVLVDSMAGRPQSRKNGREPHASVLQTKHIKEIDGRPRGSARDRVKLWLTNVTVP